MQEFEPGSDEAMKVRRSEPSLPQRNIVMQPLEPTETELILPTRPCNARLF